MFFIKMLNELSLYVLVVHSAHQKSSVNSDIQGRVDRTQQRCWDKPARKLEDELIINHLCTTVQHSDAFQHLFFLGKVNFFSLLVFHNLWLACCFKEKETAKYHCVLQIFVWSTGQCCCGWIPSVMLKHCWTCLIFYTVLFKYCAFIWLFDE